MLDVRDWPDDGLAWLWPAAAHTHAHSPEGRDVTEDKPHSDSRFECADDFFPVFPVSFLLTCLTGVFVSVFARSRFSLN